MVLVSENPSLYNSREMAGVHRAIVNPVTLECALQIATKFVHRIQIKLANDILAFS